MWDGARRFPTLLAVIAELAPRPVPLFLGALQEVAEWQRLVRALLDRGRVVCVTGSNASLIGRELGRKLRGAWIDRSSLVSREEICKTMKTLGDG